MRRRGCRGCRGRRRQLRCQTMEQWREKEPGSRPHTHLSNMARAFAVSLHISSMWMYLVVSGGRDRWGGVGWVHW